jgi:hypothetical protein
LLLDFCIECHGFGPFLSAARRLGHLAQSSLYPRPLHGVGQLREKPAKLLGGGALLQRGRVLRLHVLVSIVKAS